MPYWISHRGLQTAAVENTAEAFRAALSAGFDAVETDLRLTRDGHIVLSHDADLRRLCEHPRQVSRMTRSELEKLSLRGGGRILFFDHFLEICRDVDWTFDLKRESFAGVLEALLHLLRCSHPLAKRIAHARYVTWSSAQERRLRSVFPNAFFYPGEAACWRAGMAALAGLPRFAGLVSGLTYALPPRFAGRSLYRPEIIKIYHAHGARVLAYLPSDEVDTAAALAVGCDEILTNYNKVNKT